MNRKIIIGGILVVLVLIVSSIFLFSGSGERKQIRTIEELAQEALIERNIGELYTEATREKPYFEKHPEELKVSELKIENFEFTKNRSENIERSYSKGEEITFSFDIIDYMNPKVKEDYYIFGIEVYTETKDSTGNIVKSLSQKMIDLSNHYDEKGINLLLNLEMNPDSSVSKGEYTLEIRAIDKISNIEKTFNTEFEII